MKSNNESEITRLAVQIRFLTDRLRERYEQGDKDSQFFKNGINWLVEYGKTMERLVNEYQIQNADF